MLSTLEGCWCEDFWSGLLGSKAIGGFPSVRAAMVRIVGQKVGPLVSRGLKLCVLEWSMARVDREARVKRYGTNANPRRDYA